MLAYTFYESDNRVRRYADTLVKRGDEVDAIVLRRQGQPAFEVIAGVRVHRIQRRVRNERNPATYLFKLILFFFRSAWVLTLFHLKRHYNLIHVHSVPDFEVFATIIARLLGARVILDIHDIVPEFYASKFNSPTGSFAFRLLLLLEKWSLSYADHVVIANHLWSERVGRRSVSPQKCTVIMNYPDPGIFSRRRAEATQANGFVMCYPGTLNWHQGVDRAIEAVALLRDAVPQLHFLIIGDGPDSDSLHALVRQRRLEDRVSMTGSISIEDVASRMATVDLGVVPKRSDSFGNEAFSTKILEFMAMGVPVLASRTAIDQLYFDDTLVQFFESDSVADLAAQIQVLVNDATRRDALRAQADRFIRQNNWDVKRHVYLDLVDRLVDRRPPLPQTEH